ncbi:hypothetical protein GCM10023093_18550 [Nemorincola caseinilytica]|uniref:beta-lactamase n=1 Tax=Nemorincola caseinilytica TaxID=2054315 RepID=A0ABP8NE05_9BACT
MLKRKIPVIYMVITIILGCVASVVAVGYINRSPVRDHRSTVSALPDTSENCEYSYSRLEGYKYVQPLYLAEPKCESGFYIPLKGQMDAMLNKVKAAGDIENASVYIKDFSSDGWMAYNTEVAYHPGSLFKVITMISFFRMAEAQPSLLSKEVLYPKNATPTATQTFRSQEIKPGTRYTIRDLIYRMIVYSDNDATLLLHEHIDKGVFTKVFSDLGLKRPASVPDPTYQLSVKEYSRFVSVLYEGGYLSLPASESAISLLCESDFAQGITKQLPRGLTVAHKFGEAGEPGKMELHESAIVYLNDRPYLITIMTRGKNSQRLAAIMSDLSKLAYDHMLKRQA